VSSDISIQIFGNIVPNAIPRTELWVFNTNSMRRSIHFQWCLCHWDMSAQTEFTGWRSLWYMIPCGDQDSVSMSPFKNSPIYFPSGKYGWQICSRPPLGRYLVTWSMCPYPILHCLVTAALGYPSRLSLWDVATSSVVTRLRSASIKQGTGCALSIVTLFGNR